MEMFDAHAGWFVYESSHDDGGPLVFDCHLLIDADLRIVHVYNMIHVHDNDDYPGGHASDTTLRSGVREMRRAHFPFFFRSLHALLNFVVAQFFGKDWSHGVGFDDMHCENIKRRGFSIAMQGGLETLLPACVVNQITDSLVVWACPVALEHALVMSKAYGVWRDMHLENNVRRKYHHIICTEFLRASQKYPALMGVS